MKDLDTPPRAFPRGEFAELSHTSKPDFVARTNMDVISELRGA